MTELRWRAGTCCRPAGDARRTAGEGIGRWRTRSGQLCAREFGADAFSGQAERAMLLSPLLPNDAISGNALDAT
ncbi:hypothetical protein [Burkholderia dolosa]|uniref:hypothetical protein n=1 Tax=Burkholderia dolosa TaxID=152500 RepID=UPI0015929158|nr:hypothetical protein [Burkholderia dolosa]MBY4754970.1 hypothetical protein [Burkholderia dolosa]